MWYAAAGGMVLIVPQSDTPKFFTFLSYLFTDKERTPTGVSFLCHFVWKYRMPSVRGPQWLETVQPARVCSTSSKG